MTVAPTVRVCANGSMSLYESLDGDADADAVDSTITSVAANQPVRLSSVASDMQPMDHVGGPQILEPTVTAAPSSFEQDGGSQRGTEMRPMRQVTNPVVVSGPGVVRDQGRSGRLQSADRSADSIIDSIVLSQTQSERIHVARNSSAVINLKTNVDGVEVADPTIADVYLTSPTRIVVTGKGFGSTQLLLRIGGEHRTFHVDVELDLSVLKAFIRSAAPTSDVHVRSVNGTIFLSGTVRSAESARQIVDMAGLIQGGEVRSQMVVTGVQQTLLRVVVAEVNKAALRQLGINWAIGASDLSRDFFFANNLNQLNPTTFGSSGLANVLQGQQLFSVAPVANGATTNITFGFPRAELQYFINALRENNLARTLAEPNLVAISGQTATFLAGGEVPITVVQSTGGAAAISVFYKEFGVRLGFTPTVLSGQVIRLHVMSEVSEPVPSGTSAGGLPLFSFNTRRVESTIECGNGQTFAIAGLLSQNIQSIASKIPGLGDVPILGTLFSSTSYQKSETELVVLVTPQLVEPLDPHQVPPAPGTLSTDPTDLELFTLQKLEGTPRPRPEYDRVPRDEFPVKTRPGGITSSPASQFALHGPWGMAELEDN